MGLRNGISCLQEMRFCGKQYAAAVDPATGLKLRTQKIFKLQLKKTEGAGKTKYILYYSCL